MSVCIKTIRLKKERSFYFLIFCNSLILYSFNEIKRNNSLISNVGFNNFRNEFKLITQKIKSEFDIENISLLTFETDLMIWSILNDIRYLDLINALFTSKKDYMIEDDLISSFKKLKLTDKEFYSFISNKKDFKGNK